MELFDISFGIYVCSGIGITLIILTIIQMNKGYLYSLGYSKALVSYSRSYTLIRNLFVFIYLTAIILLVNWLVDSWIPVEGAYPLLAIKAFIILCLIVPAVVADNLLWNKTLKYRVVHDQLEITFDFKNRGLSMIFNPWMALIITLLTFLYAALVIQPFFMIYIHLALPWLFYHSLKNKKFLSNKHLKQTYKWTFIGITINYLFVLYYIISGMQIHWGNLNAFGMVSGIMLCLLLIGNILFHTYNIMDYTRVNKMI